MAKRYAVIYRTGGTANFRWHRVLDSYTTQAAAAEVKATILRQGYVALVHDADLLDRVGMPEELNP